VICLPAAHYWSKLTDYYYDHIHWDLDSVRTNLTLRSWAQQEYGCRYVPEAQHLEFDDEKVAMWFRLLWD
jgi:hypothetical protein